MIKSNLKLKSKLGRALKYLRTHRLAAIIIISLLLLFIVIVCFVIWSMQTWSQYSDNYNRHFNSTKIEIDSVITQTTPKKTNSELTAKLSRIVQTQNKIKEEINSFCNLNSLVKWQTFIGQYTDKLKDCEHKKGLLRQLIDDLSILTSYLGAEQRLASIISNTNEKTTQNNQADKWKLIEPFWNQAVIDISKLPSTTQFKSIKALANRGASSVAEAWKQLTIANEAKNRQNFEKAKTDLSTAYTLLSSVGDSSKTLAEKLVTDFNSSYKKTF